MSSNRRRLSVRIFLSSIHFCLSLFLLSPVRYHDGLFSCDACAPRETVDRFHFDLLAMCRFFFLHHTFFILFFLWSAFACFTSLPYEIRLRFRVSHPSQISLYTNGRYACMVCLTVWRKQSCKIAWLKSRHIQASGDCDFGKSESCELFCYAIKMIVVNLVRACFHNFHPIYGKFMSIFLFLFVTLTNCLCVG